MFITATKEFIVYIFCIVITSVDCKFENKKFKSTLRIEKKICRSLDSPRGVLENNCSGT